MTPDEPCYLRFVLGGRENACTVTGEHTQHRVTHPVTGKRHVYEFAQDPE